MYFLVASFLLFLIFSQAQNMILTKNQQKVLFSIAEHLTVKNLVILSDFNFEFSIKDYIIVKNILGRNIFTQYSTLSEFSFDQIPESPKRKTLVFLIGENILEDSSTLFHPDNELFLSEYIWVILYENYDPQNLSVFLHTV